MARIKVVREYPKYKDVLERVIWESGLKVCSTYAHSMNLCFGHSKLYNLEFYDKCSNIVGSVTRGNDSSAFFKEKDQLESYGAHRVSYMLIKIPEHYFIPSVPNTLRHLCLLFNPNDNSASKNLKKQLKDNNREQSMNNPIVKKKNIKKNDD